MKHLFAALLLSVALLPVRAQDTACVSDYRPDVNYFPEQATITDAENFTVDYFNHYKVVTVTDAYDSAEPFTYVLVQCGTPSPDAAQFPDGTQFVAVPTGDIITLQTTQIPYLDTLGLLDRLVGLDSFDFVNNPTVREKIDAGELAAVGFGSGINVEVLLDLNPDIVMTSGFNPATDAHPVLLDAGIFTALDASWREDTPLARAEWLKYMALFYNAEAEAEAAYADIVAAYNATAALAATVPADERPTVLWNRVFAGEWVIPGDETYLGRLMQDAGGVIAMGDEAPADSAPFSLEAVYAGALDADIWITNAFGVTSLEALLAEDPRYADFAAVARGAVWNNDRDVNANGGNNYYELGVTSPHLVLQDMVAMFHPDLLPDHEFRFFRVLPNPAN